MRITSHKGCLTTFRVPSHETHPGKAPRRAIFILLFEQTNHGIHECVLASVVVANAGVNIWHFQTF